MLSCSRMSLASCRSASMSLSGVFGSNVSQLMFGVKAFIEFMHHVVKHTAALECSFDHHVVSASMGLTKAESKPSTYHNAFHVFPYYGLQEFTPPNLFLHRP